MARTGVVNSLKSRVMRLPLDGNAADVAAGALLMPGVTAETDLGVLRPCTATSNTDVIGVLRQLHDFSVTGDAEVTGTVNWFREFDATSPDPEVELLDTATLVAVPYSLAAADDVAVTSYSAPTITITSLEDNIDTSFAYITVDPGAGQLTFLATSASGSVTHVTGELATAPTSSSSLIKIYRLFHTLVVWVVATATVEQRLGTTAAVGSGRVLVMDNHIIRNGLDQRLDPEAHSGLSGLDDLTQLQFYSILHLQNTGFHPID